MSKEKALQSLSLVSKVLKSMNYIKFMLFNMYSHPVSVNALNRVVSITTLELRTPSCPIFFAITKQLTVVADPSITSIATSFFSSEPQCNRNWKKDCCKTD